MLIRCDQQPTSTATRRSKMPKRMWMMLAGMMALILYSGFFVASANAGPLYSLIPPSEYVLFMGPLIIQYRMPANVSLPHAFVKLEYQGKRPENSKHITTVRPTLGKNEGVLEIECGVLEFAGMFTLKMYARVQGKVLTETKVKVSWPEVILSMPDTHLAQTVDVELRVVWPKTSCHSLLDRFSLDVNLLFQRKISNTSRQGSELLPNTEVISKLKFNSSDIEDFTPLNIPLRCQLFDVDGFYQTVIESSAPESPLVAKSNIMSVSWSKQYFLKLPSQSIFPCKAKNSVILTYTHPACSDVDKIRVYALFPVTEGSPASPLERKRVIEQEAVPDKNKMVFGCELFAKFNSSAAGFVFVYVSVTRDLTFYTEQTQLRVSAWPDSEFPVDGGWSQWSSWSACSVSCGIGKRSRVRMCDSPSPKHGGLFCDGKPFQWTHCSSICADFIPPSPLRMPPVDPKCVCGCTKKDFDGEIIATGRCYDLSVWIIETRKEWVVSLTFGFFGLNHTRQLVQVRDGRLSSDELLFSSSDLGYPLEIVSSGPVLRVEMTTTYPSPPPAHIVPQEATLPIHAQGFQARYRSKAPPEATGVTSPVLYPYKDDKTVMSSSVTIIGIVLCIIVILATLIFVILQRTLLQKRVKYRSAPTVSGSPSHGLAMVHSDSHLSKHRASSLLTTSQISSSNASSPDAGTILVDMEKPLTGKNKNIKSEYYGEKYENINSKQQQHFNNKTKSKSKSSKASSNSSTCGNKNKTKLFSPSTSSDASSSKPGSKNDKDYASTKSGLHELEIINGDKNEKYASKSQPQIHLKQKPSPINPSPVLSKFDILKNKRIRKKSTSEGASSSDASSSQKSRSAVSTTKAEVNWPQSNFVKTAWNEMGKPFYDRHRPGQRPPSEEIPLIDTSSQESPSHINNLVKSESTDSAASALLTNRTSNVRRPTSLTESYSSVQSKCDELTITESPSGENVNEVTDFGTLKKGDFGTLKKGDTVRPRPSPSQITPSSSLTPTSHMYNNDNNITSSSILKSPSPSLSLSLPKTPKTSSATSASLLPTLSRTLSTSTPKSSHQPPPPHQQPPPPSLPSVNIKSPLKIMIPSDKKDCTDNNSPLPASASSTDNPHQRKFSSPNPSVPSPRLTRPDSQSQSQRRLNNMEAPSPSVLSKASSRGSKTTISSPTRSITTPSEAEGLELEYDDFIEDDPLSYFDYEQTQKLAFRGSEKIGKSPIDEDEEDENASRH